MLVLRTSCLINQCGLTAPMDTKCVSALPLVHRKGERQQLPQLLCTGLDSVCGLPEGWYTHVWRSKTTLKECVLSVKNINVPYIGNVYCP